MTPAQIASQIARQCLREALEELRPCLEYREQHDPAVAMLNRLMRPVQFTDQGVKP